MRIKVYKESDDKFEGNHPNNINEGDERTGEMKGVPVVGQSFLVFTSVSRYFQTSVVTEVLEESETKGRFKTLNSTYSWEEVKEEQE